MKKRLAAIIGLAVWLIAGTVGPVMAVAETEPNDSPATANDLAPREEVNGSISPSNDIDYFAQDGINTGWGFIALLNTVSSTGSKDGTLTALGNDGATELQSDTGSWEFGSGIALQNFADGSLTHYLLVKEAGSDAEISAYTLRYYTTVTDAQPEAEPNETPAEGTPSSFTHSGTLNPAGDVDCYAFHGRAGDTILLAINGDPEGDDSPLDPVLDLIDPAGAVLKSADFTGPGGKEFIEYTGLASEGVYAYCVRDEAGGGDPSGTYKVGLVRNYGLYFPSFTQGPTWLNPPPDNIAQIGDELTFRLEVHNTSPVSIPGNIRITTSYPANCLSLVSTSPEATSSSPGFVSWEGQKSGLAPGEVYFVTVTLRARVRCSDVLSQHTGLDYFFTGTGGYVDFSIETSLSPGILFPLLIAPD